VHDSFYFNITEGSVIMTW